MTVTVQGTSTPTGALLAVQSSATECLRGAHVTVTGVDDGVRDGTVAYVVALAPAVALPSAAALAQEPLMAGEVMIAFDHVARLKEALVAAPNDYVTFPAPSAGKGRGFMPVVAGLGIAPAPASDWGSTGAAPPGGSEP